MHAAKTTHSLSQFTRNSSKCIKKIKKSGTPLVLTVRGKEEVVVQSASEFRKLEELAEFAETIKGIQEGLDSMEKGRGTDIDVFFKKLKKEIKALRPA